MKPGTAAWIASLTALVTLFATNGKALVEAFVAAWLFALKLSDGPLGLGYTLLAIGISVGLQLYLRRHYRVAAPAASRSLQIDTIGIVVALVVVFLLIPTIFGFLLGALAGFMAPWVSRGIAAGVCMVMGWARVRG